MPVSALQALPAMLKLALKNLPVMPTSVLQDLPVMTVSALQALPAIPELGARGSAHDAHVGTQGLTCNICISAQGSTCALANHAPAGAGSGGARARHALPNVMLITTAADHNHGEEFTLGIDPKSLHATVLMQTVYNAVIQHSRRFLKRVVISVT